MKQTGSRQTPSRQKVLTALLLGIFVEVTHDSHVDLAFREQTLVLHMTNDVHSAGWSISG